MKEEAPPASKSSGRGPAEMSGKSLFSWKDLHKAYADASYKIEQSGLKISSKAQGEIAAISVKSKYVPMDWTNKVKDVASAVSAMIGQASGRLAQVLGKAVLEDTVKQADKVKNSPVVKKVSKTRAGGGSVTLKVSTKK